MDLPFPSDPLDHAETPAIAYSHIVPLLDSLCTQLSKTRETLVIYDPYYCKGAVVSNLSELGFKTVINNKSDFYKDPAKDFDVIVTNPPYSGDHPERLIKFCLSEGKPWFLLVPNWVYTKPYWLAAVSRLRSDYGFGPIFVAPKKRYVYLTPRGLRDQDDDGKTSPFITFWFVHLGKQTDRASTNFQVPGAFLVKKTSDLPMTYMDQFDPEYKRQRNIMKSQKRGKPKEQAWGHKVGKKTFQK